MDKKLLSALVKDTVFGMVSLLLVISGIVLGFAQIEQLKMPIMSVIPSFQQAGLLVVGLLVIGAIEIAFVWKFRIIMSEKLEPLIVTAVIGVAATLIAACLVQWWVAIPVALEVISIMYYGRETLSETR